MSTHLSSESEMPGGTGAKSAGVSASTDAGPVQHGDTLVAPADVAPASEHDEQSQAPRRIWGMTQPDQWFLAAVVTAALLLMLVHWLRLSGWGAHVVEIERQEAQWREYRVEINSANWIEWSQLEGIGQKLAERIVSDREQNGPFTSIDDLQRVKGIGPKTIERLRPWLRLGDSPIPAAK